MLHPHLDPKNKGKPISRRQRAAAAKALAAQTEGGGGGKGGGGGQGQPHTGPKQTEECRYCGRFSHPSEDCWFKPPEKGGGAGGAELGRSLEAEQSWRSSALGWRMRCGERLRWSKLRTRRRAAARRQGA